MDASTSTARRRVNCRAYEIGTNRYLQLSILVTNDRRRYYYRSWGCLLRVVRSWACVPVDVCPYDTVDVCHTGVTAGVSVRRSALYFLEIFVNLSTVLLADVCRDRAFSACFTEVSRGLHVFTVTLCGVDYWGGRRA